ncbi:MAG: glycosyltransferase family 4 protein [Pseudomonadota bacterium]
MKILYHHRTASKDGQAVHIEELIGALRQHGHEVRVVAPEISSGGGMGDDATLVHKLKAALPKALYELLELAYSFVAYRRLLKAAREFQPAFIYERYNLFLLAGAMLKRKLGLSLLLEVNAPLAEERGRHSGGLGLPWLARWAESRAWRSADFVLPVTKVLAGYVAAVGVPGERILVIPNGINRDHFAAAPTPEIAKQRLGLTGKLVLGFTGFVRDWHGVDRVIRWMATADAPTNAVLMVVGDGPVRGELEQLAADLHLHGRVRFTGVVNRDLVPEHVAAFDIALQPAVVPYASPLKLFEYLALGKAVIAPRQPNIEEILTDGDNALLFEANQPGAFEQSLTRLCADEALRKQLATAAAATIDRLDLTWLGNARKVVQLGQQKTLI